MRWERSDIVKIFLCLLVISVMLGLCMQMTDGGIGRTRSETIPAGNLLTEESVEERTEGRMEESIEERMEEPVEERMEEPAEERMEESTEERMEEPAEERSEERTEYQTEGRTEEGDGEMSEEMNKMVALTFDDGPNALYTERLLDGLAERGVKATFFLIGKNAEANPEIVRRIAEEGHLIGNHTYSHLMLTEGNETEFLEEIDKTGEIIREITGSAPVFCRPPFGVWNTCYEERLGIIPVLWDVDPKDWCTFDTQTVANRILADCHDSAIILLHDEYETSVEAALLVIDELERQGYTFVTVDRILIDP